jgi:hypothetical protein
MYSAVVSNHGVTPPYQVTARSALSGTSKVRIWSNTPSALIAVVCAGLVQSARGGYKNLWTTTASMLANAQSIAAS